MTVKYRRVCIKYTSYSFTMPCYVIAFECGTIIRVKFGTVVVVRAGDLRSTLHFFVGQGGVFVKSDDASFLIVGLPGQTGTGLCAGSTISCHIKTNIDGKYAELPVAMFEVVGVEICDDCCPVDTYRVLDRMAIPYDPADYEF